MSAFDLRTWLQAARSTGQLLPIDGADPYLEIGAASQLNYRQKQSKALLFDDIVGQPRGRRVLTGSVSSAALLGLTLGLGNQLTDAELVEALRGKPSQWRTASADFTAVEVTDGPVLENRIGKGDVNLLDFPCPTWHDGDGGPYIGTGCAAITVDRETGTPNLGAYRMQVQEKGRSLTVNIEAGKHGAQHLRSWFAAEGRAPIAGTLGHHPVFLVVAGTEVPYGVSELDYAGAILGEPVPVVRLPDTGLPVPIESELAFEGWVYPDRKLPEGPFGEWTGYYSGGVEPVLAVELTGLFHRNDPINLGAPPGLPPHDYSYMRAVMKSAMATDALIESGLAGVSGVWCHESGGGRAIVVVAIEQRYAGHSRQAGYLAAQHPVTAYMNKLVVVVDDDVDHRNLEEVMWAVSSRCDPQRDVEIMRYTWGSRVDPLGETAAVPYNSRMLIDACRPFERLQSFPRVAASDPAMVQRAGQRWPGLIR
jgi:4-hydroxy-3-polyprenylbenzoate decarboxylase